MLKMTGPKAGLPSVVTNQQAFISGARFALPTAYLYPFSGLHMRLAAIDIGSNSIHMVLVEAHAGGRFEIIAREKEMVRLAAGALTTHYLTRPRMTVALAVLDRYVRFAHARGAKRTLITATSAVREASNKEHFVSQVREHTGIDVEILSGVEEARLIALAVTEVMDLSNRRALIIDIGGGSTEFIVTDGKEPLLLRSMRLGAVRIAEHEPLSDPAKKKELARLRANLRADFARTAQEITQFGFEIVIGTSGTILCLANLATQLRGNSTATTDFTPFSQNCTLDELTYINEWLAQMTEKERANTPGLDASRADIIIAGGQLLEVILREVGAVEITTCDWALREGVLLNYITNHTDLPHVDLGVPIFDEKALSVRDKTILSIARRYEYQPRHAHQVARLAGLLFDQLQPLHDLEKEDRILLQYAALLHDIGYHISHLGHHRHAYYLIQNAELPGFSGPEGALIANITRFHRGGRPRRRRHPEYAALDKQLRRKIRKMSALLRLADALDRAHRGIVKDVDAHWHDGTWEIEVTTDETCDLELWYAKRTAGYFEKIFHTKLTISHSAGPARVVAS
ncbi:MAG: Ppx/GppA phosphatase family protein [Acidobacteriota bacterium]